MVKGMQKETVFLFKLYETALEIRELASSWQALQSQLNGRRERNNCSELFRSSEYKQIQKQACETI